MNVSRSKIAIADLLDCCEIYRDRCIRHGYPKEGDELLGLSHTVYHRFNEVTQTRERRNVERAWSVLHHSLVRIQERSSDLSRLGVMDSEERLFVEECLEEVHKYIRRYFARRHQPNWRRGA